MSVRERMEEHRTKPSAQSCHKMMDPIGFALENYDAVGVWRTKDSGFPIDATGQMFDGAKLDGPASLRKAILNHSDAFLDTFTENLLSYGVGRVLDSSDMPAVRSVVALRGANQQSFFRLRDGCGEEHAVPDEKSGSGGKSADQHAGKAGHQS